MNNNKKSNLLKPSSPAQPKATFAREKIYSVSNIDETNTTEKKIQLNRGKRTSISCFQDTKNRLQALITIMNTKNVDEVLEKLIDSHTEMMSEEELTEFKLIYRSLDKRTI